MHLRARELRRQQLDSGGIDLGAAVPAVRNEVDVVGGVHRVQRIDAVIVGVADVEAGVDDAPVQHAIALGAFGMRDRLAAPEEALRIVIRWKPSSGRRASSALSWPSLSVEAPSVRKITTLSTRGYTVESAGVVPAAPN